ncbi:MAG: 50S ribosomal protein L6 [Candidatus Omnitrophica bacterium]|nr:50S ribosomal protein L6 [Candidatus Omnitrophota bacterium]
MNFSSNTKIELNSGLITVQGPKGKLQMSIHPRIKVELKDSKIIVTRSTDSKQDKSLHGLMRNLIFNMVHGVTEGFSKELEIRGLGFRAQVSAKTLDLQLGFSHPINFLIPEGITIETPKPTQIIVKGINKEQVGKAAAKIRSFYKPEPYKGKGIRYLGEYVRHKVGKAVA